MLHRLWDGNERTGMNREPGILTFALPLPHLGEGRHLDLQLEP